MILSQWRTPPGTSTLNVLSVHVKRAWVGLTINNINMYTEFNNVTNLIKTYRVNTSGLGIDIGDYVFYLNTDDLFETIGNNIIKIMPKIGTEIIVSKINANLIYYNKWISLRSLVSKYANSIENVTEQIIRDRKINGIILE